ncbi:MAG TPA: hypothetical protein V6D26_01435 [Stenomitos sp.]
MKHPFELEICDLEAIDMKFEESLTFDEATQVGGGVATLTTNMVGEEGGAHDYYPRPLPWIPKPPISPKPPVYTTLALGEEGGGYYLDA